MKRFMKNQNGQFVIIAALLVAMMMLSLGPLLHEAATYYTREPWDEYLSLISGLELNSKRLMEISLINYTQTDNSDILRSNLNSWQTDLALLYPGRGISLGYTLSNGPIQVCGSSITYVSGLSKNWYQQKSYSSADAQYTLNMSSVGLQGYRYTSNVLLNLTIIDVFPQSNITTVAVGMEGGMTVAGLGASNFKVMNSSSPTEIFIRSARPTYNATYGLVYTIICSHTFTPSVDVTAIDERGIMVTSRK